MRWIYLLKPLDPEQVTEAVNRLLAYLLPFEVGSFPSSGGHANGVLKPLDSLRNSAKPPRYDGVKRSLRRPLKAQNRLRNNPSSARRDLCLGSESLIWTRSKARYHRMYPAL
jgi:hypothetical protein